MIATTTMIALEIWCVFIGEAIRIMCQVAVGHRTGTLTIVFDRKIIHINLKSKTTEISSDARVIATTTMIALEISCVFIGETIKTMCQVAVEHRTGTLTIAFDLKTNQTNSNRCLLLLPTKHQLRSFPP